MGKRILHVEDDEGWIKKIKKVLEARGYEVVSFDNLESAQKAAQSGEFDVYLCDGNIDGDDGEQWAFERTQEGKKAMLLSSIEDDETLVPICHKQNFNLGVLISMLERL